MGDQVTTSKNGFAIGLGKWLGTLALTVLGAVSITGYYNTNETVTEVIDGTEVTRQVASGAQLRIDGRPHFFTDTIPLTMTGGLSKYDLASVDPADYFTGSGYLTRVSVQWITAPAGGGSDVAFATGLNTATGTVVLNNVTNGTGSSTWLDPSSGTRWNGAYRLKVASLTNPTSSGSGYLLIEGYEDVAE